MLETLVTSGRVFDVMLAVVALEVIAVTGLWVLRRRGIPPLAFLTNLGAGGSLMLALWVQAHGLPWPWLAACLLAALAFHLADLAQRWN